MKYIYTENPIWFSYLESASTIMQNACQLISLYTDSSSEIQPRVLYPQYLQQTPHSSPVKASYGMSFVSSEM